MRCLGIGAILVLLTSPVFGVYVEEFAYPDGPLAGNGGWNGSGGIAATVDAERMKVTMTSGENWVWDTTPSETGSVITVTMDVMANTGEGSNFWYFYIGDLGNGYNLGFWYGSGVTANSRGPSGAHANSLSGPGTWDHLKAEVDTVLHETRFYFNGVHNDTQPHTGTPTGVGLMELKNIDRVEAVVESLYFDNLVIPEPASLGLLGLGFLFLRRRR